MGTNLFTPEFPCGRRRARRGVALAFLSVMLLVLCLVASFAVDTGRAYLAKSELQTAADAAARAAVQALPTGGPSGARTAAVAAAAANTCDGASVVLNPATDIKFVVWNGTTKTAAVLSGSAEANANAVQVTLGRTQSNGNPINLTFARLIGMTTCDVHATTTVCSVGNTGAYSIIGVNGATITGGFTDSYNSGNGPYSAATARHLGAVASNGDIKVSGTAKIDGDLRCGVGKTTTVTAPATCTGLVAPLGTQITYPSVTLPGSYYDAGDCVMTSGTVHLPGGTYVFGTLDLSGTAHVVWDGPVNLYVKNAYNVSGNCVIDTYGNIPANRKLYFLPTCTTATWSGTHSCVGELYAPDTNFVIGGSAQLFGRITAKTIALSSSGGLHYDEALAPVGQSASPITITRVK